MTEPRPTPLRTCPCCGRSGYHAEAMFLAGLPLAAASPSGCDCGAPFAGAGHTASCATFITRSEAAQLASQAVAAVERAARPSGDVTAAAGRAYEVLTRLDAQAADGGGPRGQVHVTVETWRLIVRPVIGELRAALAERQEEGT